MIEKKQSSRNYEPLITSTNKTALARLHYHPISAFSILKGANQSVTEKSQFRDSTQTWMYLVI
jgi:hypothetical protein